MRWEDEPHVRVYTRDTQEWESLGWTGQTVLLHLTRKFDQLGRLKVECETPFEAVKRITGLPEDVVAEGLSKCFELKILNLDQYGVVDETFVAAQTAKFSQAKRNKRYREKVAARLKGYVVNPSRCPGDVTPRNQEPSDIDRIKLTSGTPEQVTPRNIDCTDEQVTPRNLVVTPRNQTPLASPTKNYNVPSDLDRYTQSANLPVEDISIISNSFTCTPEQETVTPRNQLVTPRNISCTPEQVTPRNFLEDPESSQNPSPARARTCEGLINIKNNLTVLNVKAGKEQSSLPKQASISSNGKGKVGKTKKRGKQGKQKSDNQVRLEEAKTRSRSLVAKSAKPKGKKKQGTKKGKPINGKSDPALFGLPPEERKLILDLFAPGASPWISSRIQVAKKITDEVIRVYKSARKRVTGNDYLPLGQSGRKSALAIGLACLGNGALPERVVQYWLEDNNNFTDMAFPALTFIGAEKNLDRVICALVGECARTEWKTVRGHGYADESALHPELVGTLEAAGHSEVSEWSKRDLITVQDAARSIADGETSGLSPAVRSMAETVAYLFKGQNE